MTTAPTQMTNMTTAPTQMTTVPTQMNNMTTVTSQTVPPTQRSIAAIVVISITQDFVSQFDDRTSVEYIEFTNNLRIEVTILTWLTPLPPPNLLELDNSRSIFSKLLLESDLPPVLALLPLRLSTIPLLKFPSSCNNTLLVRSHPYWNSRKNSLEQQSLNR